MFEIDKEKFGTFVAELRKEKGYTQKELAEKLYISDKAISKWETGVSIPDTAMLIPLSELLDVSVTELLRCQRIEDSQPLAAEEVESIVKTAVTYSGEQPVRAFRQKGPWLKIYAGAVVICISEMSLIIHNGMMSPHLRTAMLLGLIFGAYFCCFTVTKLPTYYDENRLSFFSDGVVRMSVPGIHFNNCNWPHILKTLRIWAIAMMTGYPLVHLAMSFLVPGLWNIAELYAMLVILLGGLFVPMYVVGRKYEQMK